MRLISCLVFSLFCCMALPSSSGWADEDASPTGGAERELPEEVAAEIQQRAEQANKLREAGKSKEAAALHQENVEAYEKHLGPEHPRVASALYTLARRHLMLGEDGTARSLSERALAIWTKVYPPDHPQVAQGINLLAFLLEKQGAYQEALPLFRRVLALHTKRQGPDHPDLALDTNNVGHVLGQLGRLEEARLLQAKALELWEKGLGPDHHRVGMGNHNLGSLLLRMGAFQEARPHLEQAVRIWTTSLGPEHYQTAIGLNTLGAVCSRLGDYEAALSHNGQALSIQEKLLSPTHPMLVSPLTSMSDGAFLAGKYEDAIAFMRRALDIMEGHLRTNVIGLQATERIAFSRTYQRQIASWVLLAPKAKHAGMDQILRFKGLLARMAAAERRLARKAGPESHERIEALRNVERHLAMLTNKMPPRRAQKSRAAWQKAYAATAAKREALWRDLSGAVGEAGNSLQRLDIGLSDIQAQLKQGDVLLDFFRTGGDSYHVWVVHPTGEPRYAYLGPHEPLEAAAASFAEQCSDSDEAAWTRAGEALRDLVITPLREHMGSGSGRLFICPDAALAAVPFAALPGATKGSLLSDERQVHCISMAQDLVPWEGEEKAGSGALVVGGVDYGQARDVAAAEFAKPRVAVDRAPRGGSFLYLQGTKIEADTIGSQLGTGSRVLLGANATEARLRDGVAGKEVLHLATHGFVHSGLTRGLTRKKKSKEWLGATTERQLARGHDPLLLAGLAMAGANKREGGNGDDGILTALEASHLNLDGVKLVVLSACETALGQAEAGEGVIGLVQGFQMAGAEQIIGSLWRVDDEATKALMTKFYALWSPADPTKRIDAGTALRQAQAYVRSQEKWSHPYYWAAWILWG